MRSVVLVLCLLCSALFGAGEQPPSINASVLLRKEHPCLSAVISAINHQLIELRARGGSLQVESLAFLERALKNSRTNPSEAIAISNLFREFREKKLPLPNVKRVAEWLERYEQLPASDGDRGVPGHLRNIVCVTDIQCNLTYRQSNFSFFPWPNQTILILPLPVPDAPAHQFVTNLIGSLAMARGESLGHNWIQALHVLKERHSPWNDCYASKFVEPDPTTEGGYLFSKSFLFAIMHMHGKAIQKELYDHFHPGDAAASSLNDQTLSQRGYDELLRIPKSTDMREVLASLGMADASQFFPVAYAVLDQIDATIMRANSPNN